MQISHVQKFPRFKKLRLFDHIFYPDLLAELKQRRIPESFAAKYLQQIYLQDTQQPDRKLHGFAFANDRGGYEVTVPDKEQPFEFNFRPEAPTTFKARSSNKLFVFENAWGFLSWMAMQDTPEPEHHTVILNSFSFCEPITNQILDVREQIDTVLLFMGNSDTAQQATHYMNGHLSDAGFTTRPMQSLYQGYRNLSDYWRNDSHARKIIQREA